MTLPSDDTISVSLRAFYADLASASSSARRVGWESDAAHRLRLQSICEVLQPVSELDSVIDIGCGEGRLLEVLRNQGFSGDYRGEDLLEHHLERATATSAGDSRATFVRANGLGDGPSGAAIVCSGTFNTRVGAVDDVLDDASAVAAHEAYVSDAIRRLWERCEDTLVVDLAIADRHPPGVGIGRVRLLRMVELFRGLGPVVSVHEDGAPGEALFVVSRFRRRPVARRLVSPTEQAQVLLAHGDGAGALKALDRATDDARTRLMRGSARFQMADLKGAENELEPLLQASDPDFGAEVRVVLAQVKWRQRQFGEARALLEAAAVHSDDGRAHLAHALAGRGDRAAARAVVATIVDPWIRRELERHFGG